MVGIPFLVKKLLSNLKTPSLETFILYQSPVFKTLVVELSINFREDAFRDCIDFGTIEKDSAFERGNHPLKERNELNDKSSFFSGGSFFDSHFLSQLKHN